MPKMNVNAFLQKDYENEPPSGPKKTNPIKACPERSRMGQFRKAKMNLKSLTRKSGHTFVNRDLIVLFTRNHLFGIM